ncbi:MAG TPA: hypothetical protein VF170_06955 [Planctomycetaceae bacterium]
MTARNVSRSAGSVGEEVQMRFVFPNLLLFAGYTGLALVGT